MIISNYNQVATSPLRKQVLDIFDNAMTSVTAKKIMEESLAVDGDELVVSGERFLIEGKRIFVVGMGKVSAHMASALEDILGIDKITAGIIVSPETSVSTKKIKIHIADHPVPSERSLAGAQAIRSLKKQFEIHQADLIIALVSGGGSSLATEPVAGVTLEDKQKMTEILIACGASGYDNTRVKAVLSNIKGGALAVHFSPTPIISLVISDDNGLAGDHMTASGPFSKERLSFFEVLNIISKYNIIDKVPKSIIEFLNGQEHKTKLDNVKQFILLDNTRLLEEIRSEAERKNLDVDVHSHVHGDVGDVAHEICKTIQSSIHKKSKLFVYGGETTVPLSGNIGLGGRNQEFVGTCLKYFMDHPVSYEWCITSIATDGVDNIKESCGGIVDSDSVKTVLENNYDISDYLSKHDIHPLLKLVNSNLHTNRETETNLSDVVLCLITSEE